MHGQWTTQMPVVSQRRTGEAGWKCLGLQVRGELLGQLAQLLGQVPLPKPLAPVLLREVRHAEVLLGHGQQQRRRLLTIYTTQPRQTRKAEVDGPRAGACAYTEPRATAAGTSSPRPRV